MGLWGEWAYTDTFTLAADKTAVLEAVLSNVSAGVPVAVRTPTIATLLDTTSTVTWVTDYAKRDTV